MRNGAKRIEQAARRRNRVAVNALSALATMLLLAAGLCGCSGAGGARDRALQVACLSNLRQIGVLIEMYRAENNGETPPSLQALSKQADTPNVFACRASGHKPGAMTDIDTWTDYVYVAEPGDNQVRAYCRPGNHKDQGTAVLFTDCTVRWCTAAEFQTLMAPPAEGAPAE
ncbi:MAG: hypothetical protein JXR37_08345 [Kiritimatiellae bacterium]|nr:hypothetical protein [Kiritimatiellia bacterium]